MLRLRYLTISVFLLALAFTGRAQEGTFSLQLSNPQVKAIAQDADGYIWFGTARGLNRYNGTSYTTYYASGSDGSLNNDNILSLCQDSDGTLWIGTECGLNWYRDGRFHHMNSTVFDPVDHIEEVDAQSIAFSSKSGRFRMDKNQFTILDYIRYDGSDDPVYNDHRKPSFTDREGGLWQADEANGWTYSAAGQPFRFLELAGADARISHITPDREGNLWLRIGSSLTCVSPVTGDILWQDKDHICGGIFLNREGNLVALMDNRTIVNYELGKGALRSRDSGGGQNTVFSFSVCANGTIWLSGIDELVKVDRNRTSTRIEVPEPFSYLMPSPGDNRNFIVGLQDGMLEVLPDGTRKPFGGDEKGFLNVSALIMARDGTFWMGTYNDGIIHYDQANGQVDRFGGGDIKSIVQDNDGYIWMSTATHITRYDPWSHVFSTLFDSHYRDGRFYDIISAAKGPDGKLYFGGSGGITVVDPAAFRPTARQIPLRIESIAVNGHSYPGNTEALDLDHQDNDLSVRIAGIDFQTGSLLNYEWMLEGYEDDWHSGSVTPTAVYTHIPPGRYTFRARVREENADWSASVIALPVTIHPSPWASPWAKALYWILGLGLLGTALWTFIRFRTQKDRLALSAQREELKQQHIDFMTNISHEFRTPLSMIYAPAKELEKAALTPRNRELASLISRNAERLRALAEQLLKNQGGREERESLRIRQNDLAVLLRSMTDMFRYAATEKGLEITTEMPDSFLCWFDTEKVSKVFGNLMSNAVKYTPEGGHIRVVLEKAGENAVVSVQDDGIGVAPDKRERIFDRFERLGAENTAVQGSGIGLNYARNLAQLHKGTLVYEPNEPKGSIFRFTIPVDESTYPDDIAFNDREETPELFARPGDGGKEQTILIAEDSTEIRLFLNDLFRSDYNVLLASDGLTAEDHLKLTIPDLVLSDVIMPGKTGYALCADVKGNPDWNHVPVILLTAKADAESSVEGMKAGADAYVSKPFDPDVLKATVESILRNRRLLQQKVRDLTGSDLVNPEKTEEARLSPADSALLRKVQEYLDDNLDNPDADIAEMARELGMSYSSLYAKIKALTGETPKAYVTSYRMNIARELLLQGWNVSETADKVGSSSASTFSREFKSHFGYPPSQVKSS